MHGSSSLDDDVGARRLRLPLSGRGCCAAEDGAAAPSPDAGVAGGNVEKRPLRRCQWAGGIENMR